jgi:hypothetical protein
MTLQSGAYALRAVFVKVYARMRMHMPTRPETHTHARTEQYIMLIAFRRQQPFATAPQCYVIRTLSVCLVLSSYNNT